MREGGREGCTLSITNRVCLLVLNMDTSWVKGNKEGPYGLKKMNGSMRSTVCVLGII